MLLAGRCTNGQDEVTIMMEHELPLPRGWDAQRLEDGAWRVVPESRSLHAWGTVMLLLAVAAQGVFWAFLTTGGWFKSWFAIALWQGASAVLLYWGLTWIFGREEWRVGPGILEIKGNFLIFNWTRILRPDSFVIEKQQRQGDLSGPTYNLRAVGSKVPRALLQPYLTHTSQLEEARLLGAWLSAVTGCPLREA